MKGHLLVASPKLPDPNFFRSVVLMVQHDEEGAMGVILNRPTDITLRELWEQIDQGYCPCERPVHLGGPVPGPLMAVHTHPQFQQNEIVAGVYFATDKEALDAIVANVEQPFYIFSGYAGWGAGQLDHELEMGGWLTTPATREIVFSDLDDIWKRVSSAIGRDILFPPGRHVIDDPQLN